MPPITTVSPNKLPILAAKSIALNNGPLTGVAGNNGTKHPGIHIGGISGVTTRTATLQSRVLRVAGMSEAKTTQHQRDRLVQRLMTFCRATRTTVNLNSAIMFVESTPTKARSKLHYLSALLSRLQPRPLLDRYRAGLRRIAASEPLEQATPATPQEISNAIRRLPLREGLALYIGWRTASRMDEVEALCGEIVCQTHPTIILYWGASTKTSQVNPFQQQFYVEIPPRATSDRENKYPQLQQALARLGPHETLVQKQGLILTALKQVNPALSQHSIKRGAVLQLTRRAAEKRFDATLIPLVAKHQDAVTKLPSSTIRYMGAPILVAQLLRTRDATAWL